MHNYRNTWWCESAGSAPLEAAILNLLPYSWQELDTYTVDLGTGNIASLPDKVAPGTGIRAITSNHALVQAVGASQFPIPTANALFLGALSTTCLNGFYASNSAASSWKFLHGGNGMTIYHVVSFDALVGTQMLCSTTDGGGGIGVFFGSAGGAGGITQGGVFETGISANPNGSSQPIAINTPYYMRFDYSESSAPKTRVYLKSNLQGSANTAIVPAGTNPSYTYRFGNRSVGSPFSGKWLSSLIFNRVLSAADIATVAAYFRAKFGVS